MVEDKNKTTEVTKKTSKSKETKKAKKKDDINPNFFDVIVRPIVTEKTTSLSEFNKNVFVVRNDATKKSVKEAIAAIYKVDVEKVNIINNKGKTKRFKGLKGKRSDFKKAIVTLKDDNSIDLAGGI